PGLLQAGGDARKGVDLAGVTIGGCDLEIVIDDVDHLVEDGVIAPGAVRNEDRVFDRRTGIRANIDRVFGQRSGAQAIAAAERHCRYAGPRQSQRSPHLTQSSLDFFGRRLNAKGGASCQEPSGDAPRGQSFSASNSWIFRSSSFPAESSGPPSSPYHHMRTL